MTARPAPARRADSRLCGIRRGAIIDRGPAVGRTTADCPLIRGFERRASTMAATTLPLIPPPWSARTAAPAGGISA